MSEQDIQENNIQNVLNPNLLAKITEEPTESKIKSHPTEMEFPQQTQNKITEKEEDLTTLLNEPVRPVEIQATNIQNNFDEIKIKSSNLNFLELLEQNLENEKNNPQDYQPSNKSIKKYTPTNNKKNIVVSKPNKNEIKKYSYYADHFINNQTEPSSEQKKIIKEKTKEVDKIPSTKEKQIQERKSIKENKDIKETSTKPSYPYNKPIPSQHLENSIKTLRKTYSNNVNQTPSSINTTNKKEIIDINADNDSNIGNNQSPYVFPGLQFGGSKRHKDNDNENKNKANFVVGIQQKEKLFGTNSNSSTNINNNHHQEIKISQSNNLNDFFHTFNTSRESKQNNSNNNLLNNNLSQTVKKLSFKKQQQPSLSQRPSTSPIKKPSSSGLLEQTPNNNKQLEAKQIKNKKEENNQFEELSNLIIESKNKESVPDKLAELTNEIQKLKNENSKLLKLKEDYDKLNLKLQKEKRDFITQQEQEHLKFEAYKEEEMKKINKEKKQIAKEQKQLTELRNKAQTSNISSKKDKEIIEQLKSQITKIHDETKTRDNSNKYTIDKLKKQLEEANNKINELNSLLHNLKSNQRISTPSIKQNPVPNKNILNNTITTSQKYFSEPIHLPKEEINKNKKPTSNTIVPSKNKNNLETFNNKLYENNNIEPEEDDENYDLVFPDKYHQTECALLNTTENNGKIIKYYDNNKKEIIFQSGVRKETFPDGYNIVYFNNGDLKQIYPNGKSVYYFSDAKTIQTTYTNKLQVFKFENGQIEKHYSDKTKLIIFPDGSLRYILPDGYEETYYMNGSVQKVEKNGTITIEHENGYKEIRYPNGREVKEYTKH